MTVGRGELTVELEAAADTDTEELAQLTNQLRDELLGLDVDAVYSATGGAAPDSSKGVDLLAAGGLMVRFVLRQDLLQSIIDGVRSWLGRQHARTPARRSDWPGAAHARARQPLLHEAFPLTGLLNRGYSVNARGERRIPPAHRARVERPTGRTILTSGV